MDRKVRDLVYLLRFIKPFSKYFPIVYACLVVSDFILPKYKLKKSKIDTPQHNIFDGDSSEDLRENISEKDYYNYWGR